MMEIRTMGSMCLAVLVSWAAGCSAPMYLNLSYQPGTYARKVSPVRVGVYYPEDLRPGWSATSAARVFDGKHGKGAGMQQSVGDKDVNVFVAESLRAELAATGLRVSASPEFDRQPTNATADSASATGVERVVLGRINYFGFVGLAPNSGAGAVAGGVLLGGVVGGVIAAAAVSPSQDDRLNEKSGSNAYIDIDLWVVEPSTRTILWAVTARRKSNLGGKSAKRADRLDSLLSDSLRDAFREALWRPDFVAAMGTTLSPARPPSQAAQAPVHEQAAKAHFQAERFAEAAAEFEMAYQAGGDPALLYNLALSHRKAGNAKQALAAYEDYLRKIPDSPQRPGVEARIKELKQQLAVPNPSGK